MKIIDYTVCSADTKKELETNVGHALRCGYQPHGSFSAVAMVYPDGESSVFFYQPMVKYEPELVAVTEKH
jgi:hypothetical protein